MTITVIDDNFNFMLKIDSVSKKYSASLIALSNISFSVNKGEMVFLTGASGAGKSTLMRLLYLEEKPSQGEIRLGKFELASLPKRKIPSLRRHLGVIFQDFKLIPDRTAAENIALSLEVVGKSKSVIRRRVDEMLKLVGLWQRRNNYPRQLSGGEAQRVAMARAMVNEPLIILADEPTGNLDTENARGIFKLFDEMNVRGATILIATHQIQLAKELNKRILHLENGALENDSHE